MKKKDSRLIILLFLILYSCSNQVQFSKVAWNKKSDITYSERKFLIKDLLKNKLGPDKCIVEIVDLLGVPIVLQNRGRLNCVYYEVESKYGSDIDPKSTTYLEIKLNQDSCFLKGDVVKY